MKDLDQEEEPFNPRKYGFDFGISVTSELNETIGYIAVNHVIFSYQTIDG